MKTKQAQREPVSDASQLKIGLTKVLVFRKEVNEETGKETVKQCHQGIILAKTNSFAVVYNPAPIDKGGDPAPEMAQWHPIKSNRAWMEIDGETKVAHRIPAVFQS